MDTPRPEKFCNNRERVIEELVKGRNFATQLQILLHKPFGDHGSGSAQELLLKILRSFTVSLSVLNSRKSSALCQIPAATRVGSPSSGDRISEDSGDSSKRAPLKNRRGCYKRRKTSDSWIIVSPTIEDGHAWRKYGQKEILNAKYPRCYFRCTHKKDQGCGAIKQVQKIEEEPSMYQSTYFGHHTCRDIHLAVQVQPFIISDSLDPAKSFLLSSESKKIPSKLKEEEEESKEERHGSDVCDNLSPLDSIVWRPDDLMATESCGATLMMGPDHDQYADVISSVHSSASTNSHGLEADFFLKAVDFEDDIHFDEIEFLREAC